VVWALYDDAESSYKNAIEKYFPNKFDVHCFGINDLKFKNYHRVDLSLLNFKLFQELSKFPKPDIILASPPCESWSGADCGGRMFRAIDEKGNWKVMNKKYYESYLKTCHPVKRRYFLQKEINRILGEATIGATISIITNKATEPKVWVIENPQTSRTWDFQKYHWDFEQKTHSNLAYYSTYDSSFSTKPTIFKSNIILDLKRERIPGNKDHMAKGCYSKRSSIPKLLVVEIINQIISWIGGKK
jgi:site-specific DNA-cytosine methylase